MTTPEMYQLFQVLVDKLDTQTLVDVPIEQFLLLANLATDEYIQEARKSFEETKKIGEDLSPLLKRVYIKPSKLDNRYQFSYKDATYDESLTATKYTIYYLINGVFKSEWKISETSSIKGQTEIVYTQQDDITVNDPFNNPLYADKVPVVLENYSLFAIAPIQLTLLSLTGTAVMKPVPITQIQSSDLPEQLHRTLVKRCVDLAQTVISVKPQ